MHISSSFLYIIACGGLCVNWMFMHQLSGFIII
nr:MAG TPA: hypothetical protein [Caudoviricetes sp.]